MNPSQLIQEAELWERLVRRYWAIYRLEQNNRRRRQWYAERIRAAIARVRWNRQQISQPKGATQ